MCVVCDNKYKMWDCLCSVCVNNARAACVGMIAWRSRNT